MHGSLRSTRRFILLVGWIASAHLARAQCLEWADGFNRPGPNGTVAALATFVDANGPALYAAGSFTFADEVSASNIARWDGSEWTPLGSGITGSVSSLAVFDDGSGPALYAGGSFTVAGGSCVAKWNGTSWSALGVGTDDAVYALTVFDDGSGAALYAAGQFTTAGGIDAKSIAKWDGASWSALGDGITAANESPRVLSLQAFDDGNGRALYAGGQFDTAGTVSAGNIAKWKASTWSDIGGVAGAVTSMSIYDDGSGQALHVAGYFQSAGAVSASNIAKWDGSSWSALAGGIPTYSVSALAVFNDGSGSALYAAGALFNIGGSEGLARWNGSSWSGVNANAHSITTLKVFNDGSGAALYAGGISVAATTLNTRVGRWTGSEWQAVGHGNGVDRNVFSLVTADDGSGPALFAGGDFRSVGTIAANRIAKWDGTQWSALGSGMPSNGVNALCGFDDGSGPAVYAGGWFPIAGNTPVNGIAKWDGSDWSALGSGLNGAAQSIAVFDDGAGPALFAGGGFTLAGGNAANRIAKWDGTNWSALGTGLYNNLNPANVNAMTVFDDGSGPALYVGGTFITAGDVEAISIARWDGTSWSDLDVGTNGTVTALAAFDGALYVGGSFSFTGAGPANNIAKWDGTTWSALAGGLSSAPQSMAVFNDGSGSALYVARHFGSGPGSVVQKWNGTSFVTVGSSFNHETHALAVFNDGASGAARLFAGGEFTLGGGQPHSRIAAWIGCPTSGTPFCFGDGLDAQVTTACPCANFGQAGHGCGNSVNTGGALLTSSGTSSPDTVDFTIADVPPGVGTIFLQGSALIASGTVFGDGVRCAGGSLTRLGLKNDTDLDGSTSFGPGFGDAQISAAAVLGHTYYYQTYYRNPNASWCPPATFNVSNGLKIAW